MLNSCDVDTCHDYGELLRCAADTASCFQSSHSGLHTHHQSQKVVVSGYGCIDALARFGKFSSVEARA
jgi:hypothetical protein